MTDPELIKAVHHLTRIVAKLGLAVSHQTDVIHRLAQNVNARLEAIERQDSWIASYQGDQAPPSPRG